MYLLWLFATYGIFFFLLRSSLSFKLNLNRLFRWNGFLSELWECAFCSGFWVGAGVYFLVNEFGYSVREHLIWAFASASFCYLMEKFIMKLEE